MNECYNIVVVVKVATAVRGGVSIRKQRSRTRSRRGGVSENQIAGAAAARLFFLTAVAIAIATRPFKFHEISVSNTSSPFVSSIHSLAHRGAEGLMLTKRYCTSKHSVVIVTFICFPAEQASSRVIHQILAKRTGPHGFHCFAAEQAGSHVSPPYAI